jgi:hypothetical protein
MSRIYFLFPQAPPWRVEGLLYFTILFYFIFHMSGGATTEGTDNRNRYYESVFYFPRYLRVETNAKNSVITTKFEAFVGTEFQTLLKIRFMKGRKFAACAPF